MRFSKCVVDREGRVHRVSCQRVRLVRLQRASLSQLRVRVRDSDARQGVVRIELDCALEIPNAFPQSLGGISNQAVPSLEVQLIGLQVMRRLSTNTRSFVDGQLRAQ